MSRDVLGAIGPQLLTREQVATWLNVKPRQVEALGVPCLRFGRKTLRYVREDVAAWLEQYRQRAA